MSSKIEFERGTIEPYIPSRRTLLHWLIFRKHRGDFIYGNGPVTDFELPFRTTDVQVVFTDCDFIMPVGPDAILRLKAVPGDEAQD